MKHAVKSSMLIVLAAALLLVSGCSGKEKEPAGLADNSRLACNIKQKYKEEEKVSYADPMFNLSRDHVFEKKLEFDLEQYIKDHPDIKTLHRL